MYRYRFKIFFGKKGDPADNYVNHWIHDHPNVSILDFQYQQNRYKDHSICIRYIENNDEVLNCQGE